MEKMFERDWARACAKEKFTSMLGRENKVLSHRCFIGVFPDWMCVDVF